MDKEHAQAHIPLVAAILKQCQKPMLEPPYCVAKGINSHNFLSIAATDIQRFTLPKDPSEPNKRPVTVCYGFEGVLTVAMLETLDGETVALQAFDGVPDDKGKYARWLIGKPVVMGAYYRLGDFAAPNVVLITEGIADAISCYEATGYPVLAAISKSQLLNAAKAVKGKYPQALIVICGDNDADKGGERAAIAAAQAVNGLVVIPEGVKDFNDLHQVHGLEAVKTMIDAAIDSKKAAPPSEDGTAPNSDNVASESIADGLGGGDGQGDEWQEPDPIINTEENEDYPLEHLPKPLRLLVVEIVEYLQCPVAMAANAVLAALSLSIQGLVNVARDNELIGAVSLFLMVIAESGERKSACDSLVTGHIKELDKKRLLADMDILKFWQSDFDTWTAEREGLIQCIKQLAKNGESTQHLKDSLKQLDQHKPEKPRGTTMMYEDTTVEGLTKALFNNSPSAGIFSSEAGVVFGGHGMNSESAMRNMATLNKLWDGGDVIATRSDITKNMLITGRRLTLSLATQESTVRAFFDGSKGLARGTGFGARFLIAWPKSTQGTRLYKTPPSHWPHKNAFIKRTNELLHTLLTIDEETGALQPVTLELSGSAQTAWIEFYNDTEQELRIGGELTDIKDVTSKAADNVARMAALFHVYENGVTGHISEAHIISANHLMAWYLMESKRFFSEVVLSKELRHAVLLDNWLIQHCQAHEVSEISTRTIKQFCPNTLRDKTILDDTLKHLMELNRVKIAKDGKRKQVHLNPKLLEV
jgi:putative DNA primase/helicase